MEGLKESTFNWIVHHLCQDKIIQRLGYNMFQIYSPSNLRQNYDYLPSNNLAKLIKDISAQFPLIIFSAWELWELNEFLNHQFEHNVIIIDVEKLLEESIFEAIKSASNFPVLLKPSSKEMALYSDKITIAVFTLIKEAPANRGDKHRAPLEKILVDLFANKVVRDIVSRSEYRAIYEGAFTKYFVDEKKLFRYARRRKKDQEILNFIQNETSIRLLAEEHND
jgi:hypothetical protein